MDLILMIAITYERYGYCDALLAKVFRDHGEERQVFLFYDVNCKYSVNLKVCDILRNSNLSRVDYSVNIILLSRTCIS